MTRRLLPVLLLALVALTMAGSAQAQSACAGSHCDVLVARLEGLAPQLTEARDAPLIERIGHELSELFVIRRETTPSPQPRRRIERARFFLESGRVNKAIEEVGKMPGAAQAQRWIADAERYVAARQALDLIETSAVLEPRRLRDGSGNQIEQPSPAENPAEGE